MNHRHFCTSPEARSIIITYSGYVVVSESRVDSNSVFNCSDALFLLPVYSHKSQQQLLLLSFRDKNDHDSLQMVGFSLRWLTGS